MRIVVLALVIGCKASSSETATPEEAKALTAQMRTALEACDHAALDRLLDMATLASRARVSERMTKLAVDAWHAGSQCDRHYVEVPGHSPPLLRWTGVYQVGFVELHLGHTGVVDLSSPLHGGTIATGLAAVDDLPSGDQPGMVSDVVANAFSGLPIASDALTHLSLPASETTVESDQIGLATEVALHKHEYAKADALLDRLTAKVGHDPYIESLRAVAALGAGKADHALAVIHGVTGEAPALEDPWLTQLGIEVRAGKLDDALATLDTLIAKFHFDPKSIRYAEEMQALTSSSGYLQRVR